MNESRVRDVHGIVHWMYWRSTEHKTWTWCRVYVLSRDYTPPRRR